MVKLFYADTTPLPLPVGHRFPQPKYFLLRRRVEESDLFPPQDLLPAGPASDTELLRVHEPDYLERLVQGRMTDKEMRRTGFPWSPQLVERSRNSVGATLAASRAALQDGLAANLGGGTHHAYPDHGEGYCVFNDVAVAARAMQAEGRVRQVIVIDCDVHQGNGTAAIFAQDPTVFTFSIHGAKNFPFHKEQSDIDIALADGVGDEAFLSALRPSVEQSLELADADLAIYIAGADPFQGDRLGRMSLTKAGLAARDHLVFQLCRQRGLPVAITMGGGYGNKIEDTVDIQFQTLCIAQGYI